MREYEEEYMKIIEPSYYKEFTCVGSSCSNSCCKEWRIIIDKLSFEKYEKTNDEYSDYLKSSINGYSDKSEAAYGEFVLNKKGECPCLNENNLCNIYINYGEDYLCNTCKVYPRNIEKYSNELYGRYLALSCPEVVKYLINNKEKLYFNLEDTQLNDFEIKNTKLNIENYDEDYLNFILETRSLFIDIIQFRDIPLWQRIAMINSATDQVQEIIGCYNNWEGKLKKVEEAIVSTEYLELLKSFNNVDILKRVKFLKSFLEKKVNGNSYYSGLVNDIKYYICNANDIGIDGIIKEELEFNTYFKKFEYVMENYIVSLLFNNIPKVLNSNNIEAEIGIVMASYTAVMAQLFCIWDKHLEIKPIDFENVISNFTRITGHNQKELYKLITELDKEGFGRYDLLSIIYKM